MTKPSFTTVAATIFGIVALAHAARLALGLPVQVGTTPVPIWISWVALFVAGSLCAWGFRGGAHHA